MSSAQETPRALYASFWRRWWAHVIDFTLLLSLSGVFVALAGGKNAPFIVVAFWLLYLVGLTAEGGTPGKRMLSLRVVRLDGARPGIGRALLRELIGRPLSTIPLWLGYLWMLDQPQRQTWHDRMADTIVVRELPLADGPYWAARPPWLSQAKPETTGAPAPQPSAAAPQDDPTRI